MWYSLHDFKNSNVSFDLFVYSKKREVVPDLAPMLWHSFGTIAALLQEIINIYPAINPPNLTVSS
jgi:CCR4-NOT transcription complex subunit 9